MENGGFSGIENKDSLPDPEQIEVPSDLSDLLGEYLDSAVCMLRELEAAIPACEAEGGQQEGMVVVKRILHKLKGEAGIVGIDDIYEFCHRAELAVQELSGEELSNTLLTIKNWLDAALNHLTNKANSSGQEYAGENMMATEYELEIEPGNESGYALKMLVVEDDFTCRKILQTFMSEYGDCHIAVNGEEAVEAIRTALDEGVPYDLVCLDIMMPEMDGQEALEAIRRVESEHGIAGLDGVKVIMITALEDSKNVIGAFRTGCEAYIVKPVKKEKLFEEIEKLGLIKIP